MQLISGRASDCADPDSDSGSGSGNACVSVCVISLSSKEREEQHQEEQRERKFEAQEEEHRVASITVRRRDDDEDEERDYEKQESYTHRDTRCESRGKVREGKDFLLISSCLSNARRWGKRRICRQQQQQDTHIRRLEQKEGKKLLKHTHIHISD